LIHDAAVSRHQRIATDAFVDYIGPVDKLGGRIVSHGQWMCPAVVHQEFCRDSGLMLYVENAIRCCAAHGYYEEVVRI